MRQAVTKVDELPKSPFLSRLQPKNSGGRTGRGLAWRRVASENYFGTSVDWWKPTGMTTRFIASIQHPK